jgi:hypothetical protein
MKIKGKIVTSMMEILAKVEKNRKPRLSQQSTQKSQNFFFRFLKINFNSCRLCFPLEVESIRQVMRRQQQIGNRD